MSNKEQIKQLQDAKKAATDEKVKVAIDKKIKQLGKTFTK